MTDPFDDWPPILGRCSNCNGPALLSDQRWWHDGRGCNPRQYAEFLPDPPSWSTRMQQPSVGRIVHYVSFGTPGGEYGRECRAAVITEVSPESKGEGREIVSLAVLNPTGFFFNRGCEHHEVPVDPDPSAPQPGGGALNHPGGSWHWPERAEA